MAGRRRQSIAVDPGDRRGENSSMKTTFDLPESLVNEIKCRALKEGRDESELVADLLASGLPHGDESSAANSQTVPKTLPHIKVRPAQPTDARKLTTQEFCDWIKELELQAEVERYEKAF